jgi:type II secretory pathway pseudopilin PulG
MKRQQGFGLIEVLLAFIVVAVTAGSLLQLNKSYLEYSRDGRSREVALRLAESKLDELRYFRDKQGYQNIASGTESTALDGVTYDLDWTVDDHGWDAANNQWVTPPPTGVASGKKEIAVTVDWNDTGEPQSFTLSSVVSPSLSAESGPFGSNNGANSPWGLGLGGPEVTHTPGSFPTVVPTDLGDGKVQETSRPLPTLAQQGGSLRVNVDTRTYDGSNINVQGQDITTVSCNCKIDDTVSASLPSQRVILGGLSYWTQGGSTTKLTGKPKSGQDPLCDRCCKNHFDGDVNEFSHWYDAINTPPHAHYTGGSVLATVQNTEYLESCRLVRFDGLYEMATDWNLVVLNILDAALLSTTALQQAYLDYSKMVVIEYIRSQVKAGNTVVGVSYYSPIQFSAYLAANNISPETTNIDKLQPGLRQLLARGIYVDMVSPEYRQQLLEEVMGNDADSTPANLLKYVPFYDVNLTLLADWTTDNASVATVSSEPVETIVKTSEKYYGVFSRGVVDVQAEGSVNITASIRRSNSGITAFKPLSPFEVGDIKSSVLNIKAVPVDSGYISVTGPIKCITYEIALDGTAIEKVCNETQQLNISVLYDGQICSQTAKSGGQGAGGPQSGTQEVGYSCSVKSGNVTLVPGLPDSGYEAVLPVSPWTISTSGSKKSSVAGGCLLVVVDRPKDKVPSLPGTCN